MGLVELLRKRGPPNQDLLWIFGVTAKQIRGVIDDCPMCAIDDTDCGAGLDRHPSHCTLAACKQLGFQNLSQPDEDPNFLAVRRALHELFKKNQIWAP
jgi:hypothetical protein